MNFAVWQSGLCSPLQPAWNVLSSERGEAGALRRRGLKRVDRELSKRNFKTALSLIKQLQGKPGGLRGFGTANLVPRRQYALDEIKLNGMDMPTLLPLEDSILDMIDSSIRFASLESVEVSLNEGLEDLTLNPISDSLAEEYHLMCTQHEAGHFLVAYLLGVLPRGYTVPSIKALRMDKNLGGKVEFVGFEFLREVDIWNVQKEQVNNRKVDATVNKGKVSSKDLNRFSCVALAGLASEYLVFGHSEGLHSDVEKLDRLLKWLDFTKSEADSQMRWAVLNTVLILNRHREAKSKLAEAMAIGRSVGFCIDALENAINGDII